MKEQLPKTLAEATELADNWASAHNSYSKYCFDPSGKKHKSTPLSTKPPFRSHPSSSPTPKASPGLKCHLCGKEGHIRPRCPENPRAFKDGTTTQRHEVRFCWDAPRVPNYSVSGTIDGSWTSSIIKDTGCSCIVVAEDVLPDADVTHCRKVYLSDYLGRTDAFPVVRCYLRCPYFVGWTDAVRAPIKFASVLIGNIPGARDPNDPDNRSAASPSPSPWPAHTTPKKDSTPPTGNTSTNPDDDVPSTSESSIQQACAVQTRSRKIKRQHPLVLPALQPFSITPDDFGKLQASCSTLATVRSKASSGLVEKIRNGTSFQFVKDNGLLYRKCLTSNRPDKVGQFALVVPHKCRQTVLSVAHESPLAGHFSHRKTEMKIIDHFFWPGIGTDIRSFCRSCDKCQRFSAKGRVRPAPLKPMPVITEPFSRVAIDLVGPLSPPSSDGQTEDQRMEPKLGSSLTPLQQADLQKLMRKFHNTFSNFSGCTSTIEHDIVLTTTDRIQFKIYPVPVHLKPSFEQEVETLLEQSIIRHSSSPHCSPVVMVKKSDGTYRMAIDYRQLNSITVFHAEPTCNKEEDLHKFSGSKYFSELDLSKAYYQVPLSDYAKSLTAFPTHLGLMEFCRMPFGLVTACATYIRLMRIVLAGLTNVSFYFDNIFIYSKDWPNHLKAICSVLTRLREHHLTVKPSKCRFGVESIQYLGFWVDGTNFWPLENKLSAINNMTPPASKKLQRNFLGFVSFYRIFIPQASDYTGPLSDLLKKDTREPLPWSEDLLRCFLHLKSALSSTPVLRIPDPQQIFVLRTDASNHGLGAVLLQYHNEYPHPVSYASRKLLDREKRYSTIERECLAIVFGIVKFDLYLRGKEFILEIDHRPLIYLNTFIGRNDRFL